MAQDSGLRVIASGGVSRLEDVQSGPPGRVGRRHCGRALYEGAVDPQQLFRLNQM